MKIKKIALVSEASVGIQFENYNHFDDLDPVKVWVCGDFNLCESYHKDNEYDNDMNDACESYDYQQIIIKTDTTKEFFDISSVVWAMDSNKFDNYKEHTTLSYCVSNINSLKLAKIKEIKENKLPRPKGTRY